MFAAILLAAAVSRTNASTTIPFTMFDNRMLVTASLNGKGPFTMIVDTGSDSLVVTPAVARRLHMATRSVGNAGGAGSGSTPAALGHVSGVCIGSLRLEGVPALVLDLSPIQHAFGFPRLDGVIGYTTLRKLRMGVDIDDSRMTFSLSPLPVPKSAVSLPFTSEDGLIHISAGAVDGVHGTFVVDTGDRTSLTLFRRFASENDFYRDAPVRNVVTGIGVGGLISSDVLRTTVSLFGTTIPGVVTRASRDRGGAFAFGGDDASVGNGLLRRFNIVYDYPDATIYAWPSRYFSESERYVPLVARNGLLERLTNAPDPTLSAVPQLPRHGVLGAAVAQSPGGVVVGFVVPGSSAAQAGLQRGDAIRTVDGQSVATVAQFLMALHDLHANRRVSLGIGRNGTSLQLEATLAAAPDESDAGVTTQYAQIAADDSLRRALITLPAGLSGRAPAVLLIGGIGCYSVDVAESPRDAYMNLTHDLTRAGFITMRIEKSGVGDSQGPPCRSVDFDSEVRGYTAALAALQSNPQVDPSRVYLLGHSIGTVIAPRLALSNHIAGLIVLEAVGRDWPEYEIRNLRRDLDLEGETASAADQALIEKAQCMERLFFEHQSEAEIERALPSCKVHDGIYPVSTAYMQQLAQLNVIEPWTHLNVPVLAIYGTADFETELADHQRIVAVVNAVHAGSATLVVIPAMSHRLGHAATPAAAAADDGSNTIEAFDEDVSAAIVAWLQKEKS
ncbi:MAG TPA: alpha/beta fold hydrolase [Candidatus Cybelea sp.]|jgi:hypothetical protein|nr:alpha/beta fold hydrolase [Candidatus Cybelea sp.]